MEEKKKNIDDLFRSGLNDYQEAPRSGMWDRIEGNLDKIDTTKKPSNKRPGGRGGFMGYAVGLLILAAASFFLYNRLSKNTNASITEANKIQSNTTTENNSNTTPASSRTNDNTTAATSSINKAAENTSITGNTNSAATTHATSAHATSKHSYAAHRSHAAHAHTFNNNQTHVATAHSNNTVHHARTPHNIATNNEQEKQSTDAAATTTNVTTVDNNNAQQSSVPGKKNENTAIAHQKIGHTHHKALRQKQANEVAKSNAGTAAINTSANDQDSKVPDAAISDNVNPKTTHKRSESNKAIAVKAGDSAGIVHQHTAKEKVSKSIQQHEAVTVAGKESQQQTIDRKEYRATAKKIKPSTHANNTSANNETIAGHIGDNNNSNTTEKKITPAEKKVLSAASTDPKPAKENSVAKADALKPPVPKDEVVPVPQAPVALSDSNTHPGGGNGGEAADAPKRTSGNINFEAGVKLGYERGFSQYTNSKFLGAVYAQVGLSDKFAIMLQPTITYSKLNKNIDYGNNNYYQNTGKHKDSTLGSGGVLWSYGYYGTYDSITVARSIKNQSFIGFQIPILLKYRLSPSVALLGGVNIDLANLFVISDNVTTYHLVTKTDTTSTKKPSDFDPFFDSLTYRHPGTPYSSYKPLGTTGIYSNVRLGYMLGIDYSLADKFTIEFLISQSLSGYNNIADKNLKSVYSQPYFRLSMGYRFLNIKKKSTPYNGGL